MSGFSIAYTSDKARIKDAHYFHEKDNMWNSVSHTSEKVYEFYLKSKSSYTPSYKSSRYHSEIPDIRHLKEEDRQRLSARKQERETLETKSRQKRRHSINPSVSLEISKKGSQSWKPSFDNYTSIPTERIRLVLDPSVVHKEEDCIQYVNKKIDDEERAETEKKLIVQKRRHNVIRVLRLRKKSVTDLEEKAGVVKVRKGFTNTAFRMTDRMKSIATPKNKQRWDPLNYTETSGLIIRDQQEALTKLQKSSVCREGLRPSSAVIYRTN